MRRSRFQKARASERARARRTMGERGGKREVDWDGQGEFGQYDWRRADAGAREAACVATADGELKMGDLHDDKTGWKADASRGIFGSHKKRQLEQVPRTPPGGTKRAHLLRTEFEENQCNQHGHQ